MIAIIPNKFKWIINPTIKRNIDNNPIIMLVIRAVFLIQVSNLLIAFALRDVKVEYSNAIFFSKNFICVHI